MNKKIIIVGKSGSGKDYFMNKLEEKGYKKCLKWTTRPIRKNETQDITYHFTDNKNFENNIDSDNILIYQKFIIDSDENKPLWYYGITKELFDKCDFVMLTPYEINLLYKKCNTENIFVVYLDIDKNVRKKRVMNRKDYNDSVDRRFKNDDIDFKDFNKYNLLVKETFFDVDNILENIKKTLN